MEQIITYIVSVLSSIIICRIMLKKYLIQTNHMVDKRLKQTDKRTTDFLKDVLVKLKKIEAITSKKKSGE